MKKALTLWVLPFFIVGCAATYTSPVGEPQKFSASHDSDISVVLAKAKRVLVSEGYEIESFDDKAGAIATSLRKMRVTPTQADCGETMWLNYLRDDRTKTEVAINILVDDTALQVTANIQGEYKPGSMDQDITLNCISKGVIEREIGKQIVAK